MVALTLDLHVHSSKSFDGCMDREQLMKLAKKRGLDGICICDHQISPTAADIADTQRDGFLFIPAIEFSTEHGHLIGMFLKQPVTVPEDENRHTPFADACREIRAAGGLCILAHPYERVRRNPADRTAELASLLNQLDGIEIFNSRAAYRYHQANDAAIALARKHHIVCVTAGSDAHRKGEVAAARVTVTAADRSIPAVAQAIRAGQVHIAGHTSRRIHIPLSQLQKLRHHMMTPKHFLKTCLFLGYSAISDCFHRRDTDKTIM